MLYRSATYRATGRGLVSLRALDALLEYRTQYLGNDLSCPHHLDMVTHADVFDLDEVHVVQRGLGNGHAAYFYRLKDRVRIQCAGAAHVDPDVQELRDGDFRSELARNGPARFPATHDTQRLMKSQPVHFEHDAIGLEVQRGHQCFEFRHDHKRILQRRYPVAMGRDVKPPRCQ